MSPDIPIQSDEVINPGDPSPPVLVPPEEHDVHDPRTDPKMPPMPKDPPPMGG